MATEVVLTDVLPSSVAYRNHSTTSGTCSGTTTVTCTFLTIQPGSYQSATIYVRPNEQGTLTNSGSVRANEADPDTSNNSVTATTSVGPPLTGPDSAVSIVTTPAHAGEPFTFEVLVTLDNHAVAPVVVDETGVVAIMLGHAGKTAATASQRVADRTASWCASRSTPVVCHWDHPPAVAEF